MSTQMEKDPIKKTTHTITENKEIKVEINDNTPTGPFIRVTLDGQRHEINGGNLPVDVHLASDREVMSAIEKELSERLNKSVRLFDYKIARLANGNWLVSPPAVYG